MKHRSLAPCLAASLALLVACSDDPGSTWTYGSPGGGGGTDGGTGGAEQPGGAGGGETGGTGGESTGGTGGSDAGTGGTPGPEAGPDVTEQPWIKIVSPGDGATVDNPVTFTFEGGGGVTHVNLEADDWPLHSGPVALSQGSVTYDFAGVGFERTVVATGLDAGGAEVATHQIVITPVNPPSELVFPIDLNKPGLTLSNFDSASSTGSFGASRSGGRLHAGCDLYWMNDNGYEYVSSYYQYNNNTPIYAVADGTITGYAAFYQGTHALVVDHGDFVIRYGEVDDGGLPGGLTVGSQVTAGQHIADMGDLEMSTGYWSMLHFELYSGELTGPLTDTSNTTYLNVPAGNYQRRGDLMDCTPFLLDLMTP